jgi:hypothetical protein
VPLLAAIHLSSLEDMMRDDPAHWCDLPFDVFADAWRITLIVGPPLTWLCLRLATWPSTILLTGWHGAFRRAWVAGRGSLLPLLCHIVVMAIATMKIFNALSLLSYRL